MPEGITATELRKNVYKLLDNILESGIPLKVKRKDKTLLITPAEPVFKLECLDDHPDCIVGNPEDLVHMDWSEEWKSRV